MSNTRFAVAKSIARIGTLSNHKGVKHAALSVFFYARRFKFNGRLGGPLRRAVPFVSVVPTCLVDHPMIGTIRWSKDNTQRTTTMDNSIHCCCTSKAHPNQKRIEHLTDFTRVIAQGLHWLRNDDRAFCAAVQNIIHNQKQISALAALEGFNHE